MASEHTESAEAWKPVVGHPGYEVSDLGRVRSIDRQTLVVRKGKLLRPGRASHGYPTVALGRQSRTVHSLVAEAFIGPRPEGQEVRHLDGDRSNASLSNLRYGTPKENGADRVRHGTGTRGSQYRSTRLTEQDAQEIRALKGVVSQKALAERYRTSPSAIQAIHDGRTWRHA